MAEFGEALETKGQKMEVDYSATVDKKIPQCEALTAVIWLIDVRQNGSSFRYNKCN